MSLQFKKFYGPGTKGAKKIISFSIFSPNGKKIDNIYLKGILQNIYLAKKVYPTWVVRLYVDSHVPFRIREKALNMGSQVFLHQPLPLPLPLQNNKQGFKQTLWRFLPAAEKVRFISRDIDSRLNKKEASAVKEWCASGKQYHRMFNNPVWHKNPLLAGMIGAAPTCKTPIKKSKQTTCDTIFNQCPKKQLKPAVPDMKKKIEQWGVSKHGTNEEFLKKTLLFHFKKSGITHGKGVVYSGRKYPVTLNKTKTNYNKGIGHIGEKIYENNKRVKSKKTLDKYFI